MDVSCISQLPLERGCGMEECFEGSYLENGKDCPFEKVDSSLCARVGLGE